MIPPGLHASIDASVDGIFAFALWDATAQRYLIARDPLGVCPLYWGHDAMGRLCVASEMKALVGLCADIAAFPPGHVWDSADGRLRRFHQRAWRDYAAVRGTPVDPAALRAAFEAAVHRQLMTDVPYGVLLSGGLDSSLVAACAARFARARIEGATQGLAQTSGEMAALSVRLAGIESRLDATVPVLSHVAVLIDRYARPMMTADLDVADGRLVLRLKIKPPRDFTDKTLEVWLVPPNGTPRSLGLLPSVEGGTTVALTLPRETAEALATSELAVSLEPSGGSTTGLPTGPVLFSGAVLPVDL